jgi:NAD(P)H dehydrogenase (quinone)
MSNKILVTGASGNLGKATLNYLASQVAPTSLIGLVRDKEKAKDLSEKGIELRVGDYDNYSSLLSAFTDVDKVLLVSAVAFVDRFAQHKNAIDAAKKAGVKHVFYTSIIRNSKVKFEISGITESDKKTEKYLEESGLGYTILYNSLYSEAVKLFFGPNFLSTGIEIPVKENEGFVAYATRNDMAEGIANLLLKSSPETTYNLTGGEATSSSQIATYASDLKKEKLNYKTITIEDYQNKLTQIGLELPFARYISAWMQAIASGLLEVTSSDLETLLGRKPKSVSDYIKTLSLTKPNFY